MVNQEKLRNGILLPEVNIGLVGHVDHGKTTLTERLSGKWTDTHSEELKKGITIRLGYADTTFYRYPDGKYGVKKDISGAEPVRTISLVDAPGHESLMATMLSGAAIIDGAYLLIAANETCPQPQTREHLMALQICGIPQVVIVQNKIDLVTHEEALENYHQIRAFLKGTPYENAPVIPVSARADVNIGALIEATEQYIKTPSRESAKDPLFLVARSFDINKPGAKPQNLVGGVLGGTIKQGKFTVGQEVEILPGYMVEEKNKKVWKPLTTKITTIVVSNVPVEEATPGGSMALGTLLDPSIVKSDSFTGSLVGLSGKLPSLHYELAMKTTLLQRVVGTKEETEVKPLAKGEALMLNIYSAATVGIVQDLSKNKVQCLLKKPVCARPGDRVTISRRVGDRFRLIGYGLVQ